MEKKMFSSSKKNVDIHKIVAEYSNALEKLKSILEPILTKPSNFIEEMLVDEDLDVDVDVDVDGDKKMIFETETETETEFKEKAKADDDEIVLKSQKTPSVISKSKLIVTLGYVINSMSYSLLKLIGNSDSSFLKNHPVMKELDRMRMYIKKLSDLEAKEKQPQNPKVKVNAAAANRFVRNALWTVPVPVAPPNNSNSNASDSKISSRNTTNSDVSTGSESNNGNGSNDGLDSNPSDPLITLAKSSKKKRSKKKNKKKKRLQQ